MCTHLSFFAARKISGEIVPRMASASATFDTMSFGSLATNVTLGATFCSSGIMFAPKPVTTIFFGWPHPSEAHQRMTATSEASFFTIDSSGQARMPILPCSSRNKHRLDIRGNIFEVFQSPLQFRRDFANLLQHPPGGGVVAGGLQSQQIVG